MLNRTFAIAAASSLATGAVCAAVALAVPAAAAPAQQPSARQQLRSLENDILNGYKIVLGQSGSYRAFSGAPGWLNPQMVPAAKYEQQYHVHGSCVSVTTKRVVRGNITGWILCKDGQVRKIG